MRSFLQGLGAYLVLAGISGTVDHLWTQPVLGLFLNWFNRFAVPHVEVLAEHAVPANLGLAALGAVLLVSATAGAQR